MQILDFVACVMSRLNLIVIASVLMASSLAPATLASENKTAEVQGSLHELGSVWQDQNGKSFRWIDTKGKIVLLSMVYTSCQMTCPLIISELTALQKSLPAGLQDQVEILLFSFDPQRDTQERLAAYAKERKLQPQWRLLRATEEDAQELATILGFRYRKMASGDFAHSNLFTVLDQQGRMQHQQPELFTGRPQTVAVMQDLLKKTGRKE